MEMRFFFFNDAATTEIYTLSLHDALPISCHAGPRLVPGPGGLAARLPPGPSSRSGRGARRGDLGGGRRRSEEHTSELQSRQYLVCRLLLEKKKNNVCRHSHASND